MIYLRVDYTREMGNAALKILLAFAQEPEQLHHIDDIVATNAASAEAIERVLGAASRCIYRPTAEDVKAWLAPAQNKV